jgi:hypothetical protein
MHKVREQRFLLFKKEVFFFEKKKQKTFTPCSFHSGNGNLPCGQFRAVWMTRRMMTLSAPLASGTMA